MPAADYVLACLHFCLDMLKNYVYEALTPPHIVFLPMPPICIMWLMTHILFKTQACK